MLESLETERPVDPARRFGGMTRLYGDAALGRLAAARACVIGIGGVGSWAAEALARSGVGHLTLIDLDHIAESNINRQIHALDDTLGQAKVVAMRQRIAQINPACRVDIIDAFVEPENAGALLHDFDVVIDAIDNVRAKVAIVMACRCAGIGLVVAGGAGGKIDPAMIRIDDLARTTQDPLLSKVRRLLRSEHGFPRDAGKRFGIEAVYSLEPVRYPDAVCVPGQAPQGLACAGYGSSMVVTASFGLFAASRALARVLSSPEAGGTR